MKTDALDVKYGLLWYVVLENYLAGHETPHAIAKALGLEECPPKMRHILNEQDFRLAIYEARKRPAETAIKFIQQNLIGYARTMHGLAMDDTDKRTKISALKDLMDRGGMGAAQKIDIKSPSAYREAVKDLQEDPPALAEENPVEPVVVEITE